MLTFLVFETGEEEDAPALPQESTTTINTTLPDPETLPETLLEETPLLPEAIPLPESGDLSPTTTDVDEALPDRPEATGLDTALPISQDSEATPAAADNKLLPSESLTPLPDRRDTPEPEPTEPKENASQENEFATDTTITTEREPESETNKPDEAITAEGKEAESQTDDKPQEEPKTEEQPATASPDLASPTSETFTPRLLRRSTAKKEKTKGAKMSNPASPTMGAGWGIASPPALSLDKALEAADPFSTAEFDKRMRTLSANREAERSAKIAEKERLERALYLQRRATFDDGHSPTASRSSVLGSTSSVAADAGSIAEERPAYALKRASTDRTEKKKKLAAEKKKSRKSDWPDAWPEDFDEEATMPQEPGHPSMWPELHGRASPSPIRGRSGYRTPTPLGQYMEVSGGSGKIGGDIADSVGDLQDGGPKDIPPPEPIPDVPSKPIPDVGSDTATPSSETNKELGGTLKASGKKGRRRRSSSLAVTTDKDEELDANNSEAEQGDLDTQPSGSAPDKKVKKNKRGRKGKGKATDTSPAGNAEDAEGQEASDGDEEPSSGTAQDANAGAAGDASGKKKRKKNKKKGSQTPSGVMSPPLEPNPEVAQLTAQLAQLTDLVQQLVVDKSRSASVDPAVQGRSRRSSSVTKGNPKIRRTSSGNGGDGEALYDSDGFSIHDEDEEPNDDDDNNETAPADENTTKAKRFMGVPYRRGSKSSKSDKGGGSSEKGDKAKDKHQQQVGEDPTSELDPTQILAVHHLKTTPREEDERQTGNDHHHHHYYHPPQTTLDVTTADNERFTPLQELFFAINDNVNIIQNESRDSEAGDPSRRQVVIERAQGNEHADQQPGAQPAEQLQQGRGRGKWSPGTDGGREEVSALGQQAGQEQGAQSHERLVEDQGRAQPGTDSRDRVRGLGAGGRSVLAGAKTGDAQQSHDGYEPGQAGLQEAEVVVGGWRDGSQTRHGDGRGVNQSGDGVDYTTESVRHDETSIFGDDSNNVKAKSQSGSVRDGVDFRSQAEHDEESHDGNDPGSFVEAKIEHGLDGGALGRTQDEHGLGLQELQHGRQVLQGTVEDSGADQSGTEHRSGSTGYGQCRDQSAREPSAEGRSVAGSVVAPTSKAGNDEASVDRHEPSRLTTGDGGSPRVGAGARKGKAQDARPADVRDDVEVALDHVNGRGHPDSGLGVQQHARTGSPGTIETGIWVGVWIKLDPSSATAVTVVGKEQDQQDDEDARVGRVHEEGQEPGAGRDAAGDEQTWLVGVASDHHSSQAEQTGSDNLRYESVQAQEEHKPRHLSAGRGLEAGDGFVNAAATAAAAVPPGETGSQPGAQVENGQLQQGHDAGADQGQDRQDAYAQPPRAGHGDADAYGVVSQRALERVQAHQLEQQSVPREPGARGQAEGEDGKSHVGSEHPDQPEQCISGTPGVELPGDNDQYQPDGTDGRDGFALASFGSDNHHGDRQYEKGKVKDVLQERRHPRHGEQQSLLEQSETERRDADADADADAAGTTATARDAEAGITQLWVGRFSFGITAGDSNVSTLPPRDIIRSSSPTLGVRRGVRVDVRTGDVVRVSQHGDSVVGEIRSAASSGTKGPGDSEHDEPGQELPEAGDVVTDKDGHEYRQSEGLERQPGSSIGDGFRRDGGTGKEGKQEGHEYQCEKQLESCVDGDEGDGEDGDGGHGRDVWEEEGEGEGDLEGLLFDNADGRPSGLGDDNGAGGSDGLKMGAEEVKMEIKPENVELPRSPSIFSEAGELSEAVVEPIERNFDQQLEKDSDTRFLPSINPQDIELPPSLSTMTETEEITETEIAPIEQILSQQCQNDPELPSSRAVNPQDVQLPASPSLSSTSDAGELSETENEPVAQIANQQSFQDAGLASYPILNPEQIKLPASPSTLSDAGDLTDTEPVVEQAKQIVEPLSPATGTADRSDQDLDKVRIHPSPTSFGLKTNRMS